MGLPLEASKNGILATDETRICTDQIAIVFSESVYIRDNPWLDSNGPTVAVVVVQECIAVFPIVDTCLVASGIV